MSDSPPIAGTVVITGASSGIGRELAKRFAAHAKKLVLVARREGRMRELADELTASHADLEVDVRVCDLSDALQSAALVPAIGEIDVLVNNAGYGDRSYLESTDLDKLERMIAVNVTSLTSLCRRVVAGMLERGAGGILNISSAWGESYMPGMATYIGTKHYVTGFTHSLRAELAGTGVVVTQVCPGPVETEFDALTENQTALGTPRFMVISAMQCADEAFAGFVSGQAIVYPGLVNRMLMFANSLVPGFVFRWVAQRLGRNLRDKRPPVRAEV